MCAHTLPWTMAAAARTAHVAQLLMVLDSLRQKNLSCQSPNHPPQCHQVQEGVCNLRRKSLTIANVGRVDRVVRGTVVSWDAPLTVNASGVMLEDRGLHGHQFLCLQDRIHAHLPDLLTAQGPRGSNSGVSAHRPKFAQNSICWFENKAFPANCILP